MYFVALLYDFKNILKMLTNLPIVLPIHAGHIPYTAAIVIYEKGYKVHSKLVT